MSLRNLLRHDLSLNFKNIGSKLIDCTLDLSLISFELQSTKVNNGVLKHSYAGENQNTYEVILEPDLFLNRGQNGGYVVREVNSNQNGRYSN